MSCPSGGRTCGAAGTCYQPNPATLTCLCTRGYAFDTSAFINNNPGCQPYDICNEVGATSLCFNGGTCASNTITVGSNEALFTCTCGASYSGDSCENFNDPCAATGALAPCQNGGTCVFFPFNSNQYLCECATGFSGENCETELTYGIGGVGSALSSGGTILWWSVGVILLLAWLFCCCQLVCGWLKSCIAPLLNLIP